MNDQRPLSDDLLERLRRRVADPARRVDQGPSQFQAGIGSLDEPPPGTTDDLDPVTLGRRVRHFRVQRGLTLTELGQRVGVGVSQLSLLENGRREPRVGGVYDRNPFQALRRFAADLA